MHERWRQPPPFRHQPDPRFSRHLQPDELSKRNPPVDRHIRRRRHAENGDRFEKRQRDVIPGWRKRSKVGRVRRDVARVLAILLPFGSEGCGSRGRQRFETERHDRDCDFTKKWRHREVFVRCNNFTRFMIKTKSYNFCTFKVILKI